MNGGIVQMSIFLDNCQDLESITADLYHLFADYFSSDKYVARLWRKTALEEENHARQVKLAKKLIRNIVGINLDFLHHISISQEKIRTIVKQCRACPPDLEEALRVSIKFEEQMEKFHMHNAICLQGKSVNALFVAMMESDRGHITELQKELDKLLALRQPMKMAG